MYGVFDARIVNPKVTHTKQKHTILLSIQFAVLSVHIGENAQIVLPEIKNSKNTSSVF